MAARLRPLADVDLDSRKQKVLAAIVRDYVETVEPVGSEQLVARHGLQVSSATVRNDMSVLEAVGLIHQPYRSAGRVPSDPGYRYFVDRLIRVKRLDDARRRAADIRRLLQVPELEEILRHACRILSEITKYTAVAVVPGLREAELRYIDVANLGARRLLVTIVTDIGHIMHCRVDSETEHSAREVEVISNLLRRRLTGMRVSEIEALDPNALAREARTRALLLQECFTTVRRALAGQRELHILIDGVLHTLRQPEFLDPERLDRVMAVLDPGEVLEDVLQAELDAEGTSVTIGSEHDRDEATDLSLVTAPYEAGSDVRGLVGVLGPTRMKYEEAIGAVEYVAGLVEQALTVAAGR